MTTKIVLAGIWMLGSTGVFCASENMPTTVDWKAALPLVQLAVRHEFPKVVAQAHYAASIASTVDIAGSGVPMALVDLGTGGYTEEMTVMRMEGTTPVVARFRGKDDKTAPMVFLSGVSQDKGESLELIPHDHMVFSGHWVVNGAKLKKCGGEAYQWDETAKNFEFEKKLTKSMTKEFCQKVEAKLGGSGPSLPSHQ